MYFCAVLICKFCCRDCYFVRELCFLADAIDSPEHRETVRKLTKMAEEIKETANKEEQIINKIKFDSCKSSEQFKTLSDKLLAQLTTMKLEKQKDIDETERSLIQMAKQNIETLDKDKSHVRQLQESLVSEGNNATELFTDMVLAQQRIAEIRGRVDMMKKTNAAVCLNFNINSYIMNRLSNFAALGDFETFPQIETKHASDRNDCCITDICQVNDRVFLLCDVANECVKLMDIVRGINGIVRIPAPVESLNVSKSRADQAIISITAEGTSSIHCLSLEFGELKLDKKFQVKSKCAGLACNGKYIFVCCGGGDFGPVLIKEYQMNGVLKKNIRVLDPSRTPILQRPSSLRLRSDGKALFVADADVGIVKVNIHEKAAVVLYPKDKLDICGCILDLDDRNHVYFCDKERNRVMQMSAGDGSVKHILDSSDSSDCLSHPTSLCFDKTKIRLLVSCDHCKLIHVYTVPHYFST